MDKGMVEMYIGGVGKGYLWANVMILKNKETPLFCFNGGLTTKQFHAIAFDAVTEFVKIGSQRCNDEMVEPFLQRLKKLFLC